MTERAADDIRWQGHTHEELYRMLHAGLGPAAAARPARRWAEISGALSDIGHDQSQAMSRVADGWAGPAANAAHGTLSLLVDWAGQASASADLMRQAVENQADHLARARAEMPAPEGVSPVASDPTAAGPAVAVLAVGADAEPAEAAASAGERRAFEVMAAYDRNTRANLGELTELTHPTELTPSHERHRGHGPGVHLTGVSGMVTEPVVPHDHGRGPHDAGRWGGLGTSVSGAAATLPRALPPVFDPVPVTATPMLSGPVVALGRPGQDRTEDSNANRPGGANGAGPSAGARGGGPVSSAGPSGNVAAGDTPELQSAAASPAVAAGTAPGAAAPASTAGAGMTGTGSQDRIPPRRFGVDPIGSGQWFGETDDAPSAPRRRSRELTDTTQVTESVRVDGVEHRLAPTVIGSD